MCIAWFFYKITLNSMYPMLFVILLFGSCLLLPLCLNIKKCRENRIKYDSMQ